ncbi:MAG: hypothetical protein KKC68_06355 [Candidatus Thermoplasmatota archaeon]|nr:hypothetical protein [Candidatus Thermoplasmatota archaeon]MBU1941380.1 hypothetical protein [Candidatus Thermoplasmatota archaeon]
MKIDEWLHFFKQHQEKKIFSLADLIQITGQNKPSLTVQLTRLVNANILARITRGLYANPFTTPSLEEAAMIIRYPSYLSMEYALSKHGILSQTVYTITLVTTKLPYTYKTNQTLYEYHQINRSLFWGYQQQGTVLTAEPEKALLDLIYLRNIRTTTLTTVGLASLVHDMAIDELNKKKLIKYSKKFSPPTQKMLSLIKNWQ